MEQKTTILVLVISGVLLVAGVLLFAKPSQVENTEDITLAEKVKGNPEASVVLVEYSDLQCPACAGFAPVVKQLIEDYGDNLALEYKHFPLPMHRAAVPAARAAEAAGVQGKFWEMHDMLFERQSDWGQNINPESRFMVYAEELGLNMEQFERNYHNAAVREAVESDLMEGRSLDVNSTPTFYLNGEKVDTSNMQTYADFVNVVEIALGVAEAPAEAVPEVEFSF